MYAKPCASRAASGLRECCKPPEVRTAVRLAGQARAANTKPHPRRNIIRIRTSRRVRSVKNRRSRMLMPRILYTRRFASASGGLRHGIDRRRGRALVCG